MQARTLGYQADGLVMKGHLCRPDGQGRRPGVLVFPEVFGLAEHARSRAEALAGIGYVALAGDLHGEQYVTTGLEEALGLLAPLRAEPGRIVARAAAALDALCAEPDVDPSRIAAIGFCFGGTMALELARSGANLRAVVGFHSGLSTNDPQVARNIVGKVLICTGAEDPSIDAEQRAAFQAEMRTGGVNWQMNVYGDTRHSFTNRNADKLGRPELAAYNAQSDARSWAAMRALFDEAL